MKHASILDCTLRDGAYLIDKKFGNNIIRGIIDGLVSAGIDYVEMGFLQNDGFGDGKTVFKNGVDAARFVPENKGNTIFTVLADYSRYSIENLDVNSGNTFDAVRACFFKHERYEVIDFCKQVKELGYKVFVQPVDILGYTDAEIIEFIDQVNIIEPYCLSIVDTFGGMYIDDLNRVFSLIDHNLVKPAKIGFHSHNNMQMSNVLSQEFIQMTMGKREAVVDTTLCGMGRGAGNTPTELVVQYMVSKMKYSYDLDAILDVIGTYMDNIRSKCSWGYNTPYFIAGCFNAHVNNVNYLANKTSIRYKDIRFILNKVGTDKRKRYDYDLLENTYLEYLQADIHDESGIEALQKEIGNKSVLLVAPGKSCTLEINKIIDYCEKEKPVVISTNFIPQKIKLDYLYFSNMKRYKACTMTNEFKDKKKIVTSNIMDKPIDGEIIVPFTKLIKCGWEHMENSMILLLRLLDMIQPSKIAVAGFDGYDIQKVNYASEELELSNVPENAQLLNEEIIEMLRDYVENRKTVIPVKFITESRFEEVFEEACGKND